VAAERSRDQAAAMANAQATLQDDTFVRTLLTGFDGTILPDSVRPVGPNGDPR
jgi:hypothetical protein